MDKALIFVRLPLGPKSIRKKCYLVPATPRAGEKVKGGYYPVICSFALPLHKPLAASGSLCADKR